MYWYQAAHRRSKTLRWTLSSEICSYAAQYALGSGRTVVKFDLDTRNVS